MTEYEDYWRKYDEAAAQDRRERRAERCGQLYFGRNPIDNTLTQYRIRCKEWRDCDFCFAAKLRAEINIVSEAIEEHGDLEAFTIEQSKWDTVYKALYRQGIEYRRYPQPDNKCLVVVAANAMSEKFRTTYGLQLFAYTIEDTADTITVIPFALGITGKLGHIEEEIALDTTSYTAIGLKIVDPDFGVLETLWFEALQSINLSEYVADSLSDQLTLQEQATMDAYQKVLTANNITVAETFYHTVHVQTSKIVARQVLADMSEKVLLPMSIDSGKSDRRGVAVDVLAHNTLLLRGNQFEQLGI